MNLKQTTGLDRPAMLALSICFATTVVLGLLSDGVHHDDDLTHFLMARWARWFPEYLLHIWGRPGFTVPMSGVAWIGDAQTGWHVARLLSATVTAAAAWMAVGFARHIGLRRGWLVVVLCYIQPLNTLLGFTTLTENFTSLYLIAALRLLQTGRPVWASVVFSLVLVTRHEAVVWLPLWWIALFASHVNGRRVLMAAIASIWAPALHNLLFQLFLEEWPVRQFFSPGGSTQYTAASPISYLPHALHAIPPLIATIALIGGIRLVRFGAWQAPAFAALFLLAHGAIKALGVFASGGYGRFLVAIAPLVAICAASGFDYVILKSRSAQGQRTGWLVLAGVWAAAWLSLEIEYRAGRLPVPNNDMLIGGRSAFCIQILVCMIPVGFPGIALYKRVYSCLVLFVLATCAAQFAVVVRPLRLRGNDRAVHDVAEWLDNNTPTDSLYFATNPWFAYWKGFAENPRAHKGRTLLASMPVGTFFIWDSQYSSSDYHRLREADYRQDPHYELIREFRKDSPGGQSIRMIVFRKIAATPLPLESDQPYPVDLASRRKPVLGVFYIHAEQ